MLDSIPSADNYLVAASKSEVIPVNLLGQLINEA